MKDNKLIAEFMGHDTYESNGYIMVRYSDNNERTLQDTHYHTSWDWLMPVVGKISDIKGWSLNSTLEWLSESQDRDGLYDIEGIFQAVVEFINQINKEKL